MPSQTLQLANSKACWVDVDSDRWADLCAGGVVWRNNGGKGFVKLADGFGEVIAADFDNDGFADLFSWSPIRVYRNKAGKGFDPIEMPTLPKCVSSGACWGDFNGDGFVDVYVGGYEDWDAGITYPDMLLMNEKGKSFKLAWSEVRFRARGVTGCDFDQDGDLDLFFTTVYETASFGRKNNPVLFRNDGGFVFGDATPTAKLTSLPPTYQAAWADFDHDGDLDLVAAGKLFENQAAKGHWLELRLEGDGNAVNRSAIGAQVRIQLPIQTLTRHVEAGTGEGNQNDLVLHWGLGDHQKPVRFEIFWPNGQTQTVENVEINRSMTVRFRNQP